MSQIEIDRVLSQIRALRQRAVAHDGPSVGGLTPGARATSSVAANNVVSFDAVLRNGLDAVNRADTQARGSVTAFSTAATENASIVRSQPTISPRRSRTLMN